MEPALVIAALSLAFGGSHVVLSTRRVRNPLVGRLGERAFLGVYSLVAASTFAALVAYYAAHRLEGVAGLALARYPVLHWPLVITIATGMVIMTASLLAYPRLPSAIFASRVAPPRGIERVTRHGFFAGIVLFALPHALLAAHLIGTVFFAGLALIAVIGGVHQDAKLIVQRGRAYANYTEETSFIPFGAIIAGRQSLNWRELPWLAMAMGIVASFALRAVHPHILGHGGAWVIAAVLFGAAAATIQAWLRSRREHRRADRASSDNADKATASPQ